jgi:hypothetical protein
LSYDITPAKFDYTTFQIESLDIHTSYGVGSGMSATVPLTDNLFGLATLSGLYLFGKEKFEIQDSVTPFAGDRYSNFNEYGFNTTLSLGYYIAEASTVVSLGARVQYFETHYKDKYNTNESFPNVMYMIYGFTLTATYTF